MPSSQAEVKLAWGVLGGKAKGTGMSKTYAREVVRKMHGKSMKGLPKKAGKPAAKRYYERAREKK